MKNVDTFLVEYVAGGPSANHWRIVLVEQGPWRASITDELLRVQDRLYDCVDAVLDGQLADKVPESTGATVTIKLECYGVPGEEVKNLFKAFSEGVFQIPDYKKASANCAYVRDIRFELNIDAIN
jgi:hypothetical protein